MPTDLDLSPRCREALAELDRLIDAGIPVDRSQFLQPYADVADELRSHWEIADQLRALVESTPFHSAPPPAAEPIRSFGDYEVLEQIGQGAMGVVFKARQRSLNRLVALKFPTGGLLAGAEAVERCRREARTLAALQHPNIVAIHEVGDYEGQTYLSMEYVEGTNLAQLLRDNPPSQQQAAEYVKTIAATVDHVHRRGIVHRDLKPANILVDTSGTVRIADFGLGKLLTGDDGLTQSGQFLGTLRYTAPELADGSSGQSPQAGDIYSIGAILDELLSGHPVFGATSTAALLRQIHDQEPAPLRKLDRRIPRDLETICLKCLRKSPGERYRTAGDLADDLERFLRGEPVLARPISRPARFWRWCRRHPARAAMLVSAIIATIVAGRLQVSLANAELAKSERELALERLQQVRMGSHWSGWSKEALQLGEQAAAIGRNTRLRDQIAASLAGIDCNLLHWRKLSVSSAAFDADGDEMLLAGMSDGARFSNLSLDIVEEPLPIGPGKVAFTPAGDGVVWTMESPWSFALWNVSQRQRLATMHVPLPASQALPDDADLKVLFVPRVAMAIARDGALVAACVPMPDAQGRWLETNAATFVWNSSGELIRQFEGEASCLCFTPDKGLLAVGRSHGAIDVFELGDGNAVASLSHLQNRIHSLDFCIDPVRADETKHLLLAAGDSGGTVTVWDLEAQQPRSYCLGSHYDVYAVKFSPDGMTLASAGRQAVRLWDYQTGRQLLELRELHGPGDMHSDLAFSRDGRRLVVCAQELPLVTVWSVEQGRGITQFHGLSSQVVKTCLSEDNRILAALGQNGDVGVFDVEPPRLRSIFAASSGYPGFTADNAGIALRQDNALLAVTFGNDARLFDLETGALIRRYTLPPAQVDYVAFTPDGKLLSFRAECLDGHTPPLASTPSEQFPRVLRIRNLLDEDPVMPLAEITRFNKFVRCACVHPQGKLFVADGEHSGQDGVACEVAAFDVTGKVIWQHSRPHTKQSPFLAIDRTGTTIAFAADEGNGSTAFVNLPSGEVCGHSKPTVFVLQENGRCFVTRRTEDVGLALFRQQESEPVVVLGNDFDPHQISPCFSLDGRLLAFGTTEGSVLVCDLPTIERRLESLGFPSWE